MIGNHYSQVNLVLKWGAEATNFSPNGTRQKMLVNSVFSSRSKVRKLILRHAYIENPNGCADDYHLSVKKRERFAESKLVKKRVSQKTR